MARFAYYNPINYYGGYPVNTSCIPSPRPCMDAENRKRPDKCDPAKCPARDNCSVGKKWRPPAKRRPVTHEEVKADLLSDPKVKAAYDVLESKHAAVREKIRREVERGERFPCGRRRKPSGKVALHTSRWRGVWWDEKRKQWRTCVAVDGRRVSVGSFPGTPEGEDAAGRAVNEAYDRLGRPEWMRNKIDGE